VFFKLSPLLPLIITRKGKIYKMSDKSFKNIIDQPDEADEYHESFEIFA